MKTSTLHNLIKLKKNVDLDFFQMVNGQVNETTDVQIDVCDVSIAVFIKQEGNEYINLIQYFKHTSRFIDSHIYKGDMKFLNTMFENNV